MSAVPRHLLVRAVIEALQEDLGPGDVTTIAVAEADGRARAEILSRGQVVVAGIEPASMAFRLLDPDSRILHAARDGERIEPGGSLMRIAGRAAALLSAERTALNFLSRLSGIATLTRKFVDAAAPHATAIFDTRKTAPGLRLLDKSAVVAGGGTNHRAGLWDAILIKDNHVDLAGGVGRAISLARAKWPGAAVEVEVRSLAELDEALDAAAETVLLDNFGPPEIAAAVSRVRGRALVEVSGGVGLETVGEIAAMGVDRISVGALTHSAPAADLSMRMMKERS